MKNLTVPALLDQAKKRLGVESDYRLAKMLKLHLHTVLNYRHGRTFPDEKSCRALAAAAHVDGDVLIAQMNAMRASDEESRATWKRIAKRLEASTLTAIFAVVFALFSIAPDARAAQVAGGHDRPAVTLDFLYIVSIAILAALSILSYLSGPGFVPSFVPR